MAQNLWTYEILKEVAKSSTGDGKWVVRNEENAMQLKPTGFYASSTYSHLMNGYFEESASYCFDLWIDGDDAGLAGYNNTPSGIRVAYTDGTITGVTNNDLCVTSVSGSTKGWCHRKLVTPADKSIDYVYVYYSRNYSWYTRWDSSVTKVEDVTYTKTGLANSGHIKTNTEVVEPSKGGIVSCFDLVEY